MAIVGVATLVAGSSHGEAAARGSFVIEVNESGFNPEVCRVSRGDRVAWKNVGTSVRRVVGPSVGGSEPWPDTGDIAPGKTSGEWAFEFGGTTNYRDQYNPALTGMVQTPQYANNWGESCTPGAPTPTATPTVKRSATSANTVPTATPSPTPTPMIPPRCIGAGGCAVAASLSRDEE